jgi:hypothetical protein
VNSRYFFCICIVPFLLGTGTFLKITYGSLPLTKRMRLLSMMFLFVGHISKLFLEIVLKVQDEKF